ncbi:hypothetical protein PHYBLDRAFT_170882 [Phycomyces blakesleeanus NRRL 1555(-)]|uniref:Uncharacterized protein n=1 Tax=Phycomyces blakesleeanus (strain ATCC 8743b / DSM 1359 / FGSC 10004 / NBRC 33097 / NRRL 1555) TaxID=763407 RepID=A0A162WT73_PHYB8|nr:hypothetical protein PHYBLDRAFT_170882 [Phycomyces blakesleeanus NRRL 1555(-)]OAD70795.1 hypothetical protein PHYBLDRAFT_170882 [Phycomyces blakesleeanus NRRL 1555(-)]|eukprot:XP_018288835.1 hypothetical protein PHYBLDRAFT_170882 [Phycomyces blakesleeanus NRRL 1555(-)]
MPTNTNLPAQLKRKNLEEEIAPSPKRVHPSETTVTMEECGDNVMDLCDNQTFSISPSDLPPRSTTPPLGMTLAHYDASVGGYTASVVKTENRFDAPICSGMTPVYRAPMERWGSCLI